MLRDGEQYRLIHGDCIEEMVKMPAACMDMSVYSPPFPQMFSYSDKPQDIGNSEELQGEAKCHLSFFFKQIKRILKPGRVMVVHVMQIPGLARNNEAGIFDFRGLCIRLGLRAGFSYEYDWLVRKNPQAQAVRTKSHSLLFVTLEKDRAQSRGCLGDYLIKFKAPGENKVPIDSKEISRNEWIQWAEPCWSVRETHTLNVRGTKGENDVKHIAPLQLDVIERLIKLYSNPGEIVFDPFTGIGSTPYMAIKLGRRAVGTELKDEYYETALHNMDKATFETEEQKPVLFELAEEIERLDADFFEPVEESV